MTKDGQHCVACCTDGESRPVASCPVHSKGSMLARDRSTSIATSGQTFASGHRLLLKLTLHGVGPILSRL
jgi:hypothetical protein